MASLSSKAGFHSQFPLFHHLLGSATHSYHLGRILLLQVTAKVHDGWKQVTTKAPWLSPRLFPASIYVLLISEALFCYLGDMLSVEWDADAAVEARILVGWNKFRQLVPLLTNKDIWLIRRGKLYSSCVRSSILHGSEIWPVRKENEMAPQRAEIRMVRWMCGIKLKDIVSNQQLRERLGIVDITSLLQQNRLSMVWTCVAKGW